MSLRAMVVEGCFWGGRHGGACAVIIPSLSAGSSVVVEEHNGRAGAAAGRLSERTSTQRRSSGVFSKQIPITMTWLLRDGVGTFFHRVLGLSMRQLEGIVSNDRTRWIDTDVIVDVFKLPPT